MPEVEAGKYIAPMSGGSSYYIMKNSENATAAYQFIEFALTNLDALAGYMDLMGLPANMEAYKTAAADREFEYYGGQQILKTLDEVSQHSIEGYVFPYSADLNSYIEAASYDILNNGADVKEALEKQANEFADKYSIEVNK